MPINTKTPIEVLLLRAQNSMLLCMIADCSDMFVIDEGEQS